MVNGHEKLIFLDSGRNMDWGTIERAAVIATLLQFSVAVCAAIYIRRNRIKQFAGGDNAVRLAMFTIGMIFLIVALWFSYLIYLKTGFFLQGDYSVINYQSFLVATFPNYAKEIWIISMVGSFLFTIITAIFSIIFILLSFKMKK